MFLSKRSKRQGVMWKWVRWLSWWTKTILGTQTIAKPSQNHNAFPRLRSSWVLGYLGVISTVQHLLIFHRRQWEELATWWLKITGQCRWLIILDISLRWQPADWNGQEMNSNGGGYAIGRASSLPWVYFQVCELFHFSHIIGIINITNYNDGAD